MNKLRKAKLSQIAHDEMQLKAYLSKGRTAVIAGPGSGKTTILTLKVLKLLEDHITEPQGLACITYSREAAREIINRLNDFGLNSYGNSFFGTVHSFCIAEVLVPFSHLFDHFELPKPLRIAKSSERRKIFKEAQTNLFFNDKDVTMTEMNRERKFRILGNSEIEIPSYDIALQVANEYEKLLHKQGLIDFEDMINYSTILIQNEEFVRKCLEAKFPWILIDEYQDLGKPLHEIALALYLKTKINIFVVGDPDQSIYGFQGAIPEYLSELASFTKIEKIILNKNYRSNQDIINASEILLAAKRGYLSGSRKKERAEFHFYVCEAEMIEQFLLVINKIIPKYLSSGIPLNEIVVIVGTNNELASLSEVCKQNNIPFYIAKHDFKRTYFVQWLEDCGKWVLDNKNFSFTKICEYWNKLLLSDNIFNNELDIIDKVKLHSCLTSSIKFKDNLEMWLNSIINELGLIKLLKKATFDPDELENLNVLLKSVKKNGELFSLKNFSELGRPQDQITITTRHSSKGLEFEVVILLGMEEERFPHYFDMHDPEKLAESSRICFVCVSRAKSKCILVRSKVHTKNTRQGPWKKSYQPSRYWLLLEGWQNKKNKKSQLL
jgi:DNA helicase II / ATP-dependent DNA helicase PcrA